MTGGRVRVDGTSNIVAAGDINITAEAISSEYQSVYREVLRPFFDRTDAQVRRLFPEGVLSPAEPERSMEFSSEKLFSSLSLLGLPVEVALNAIERAGAELSAIAEKNSTLSTEAIRQAIANALYKYDSNEATLTKRQFWGDKYIRRYGSPSRPIDVIFDDGTTEAYTYQYVLRSLLPDVLSSVWGAEKYGHLRKLVAVADLESMAEEIVSVVKNLNVYRIHERTLIQLTREIALQPPHPWLVKAAYEVSAIRYDIEKACRHCNNMRRELGLGAIESCLYSYRETLHHSSSAILAYYGIFMGCGYLAPLHTLHRVLALAAQKDAIAVSPVERAHIRTDLKNTGHSLMELAICVKHLRKERSLSANTAQDQLEDAVSGAEQLFRIADDLVEPYLVLSELRDRQQVDVFTGDELGELARLAFSVIPGFELTSDRRGVTWLVHNVDRPVFRDVKSRILLAPVFVAGAGAKVEDLEVWRRLVTNGQLTNVVFFVTDGMYDQAAVEYASDLVGEGLVAVTMTIHELLDVSTGPDAIGRLAESLTL